MWGRCSSAIVLTLALALGTGTALAQPTANETAARDAFDEGTRLYGEGRYLDAARAYERAYELSPRPLLLRNISTAYERALDMGRAADALERYVDATNPADEADLRIRLARMREMAHASTSGTTPPETTLTPPPEPVQELGPPEPVDTAPPEPRPRQIDIVEQRPETGRGTTAPQPTPSEPEDGGGASTAGILSVVTGSVAVVLTVVAVVSGIMAIGEGAAVTQCVGTICPPSAADGISSARTLADTSTVSGSIGAAVGVAAVILTIIALSSSGDEPEAGERRESGLIAPTEGGALGLRF
jgi:hypothetical protein